MSKRMLVLMCSIFLIVPLLFMGCSGNDGSSGAAGTPGAPGDNGATGATGPTGPITNTNESCTTCHSTGSIADITDQVGGVHFAAANVYPVLGIGNVVLTDNGAGGLVVSFNVKSGTTNYKTLDNASFRIMLADLVPPKLVGAPRVGLDNNPQLTPQWERLAYERASTGYVFGKLDNTDAANGNYVYTFKTPLGSTTTYDNALYFDNTHVQRLYIRASATANTNAAAFVDFTLKDLGGGVLGVDNILANNLRQFVVIDACMQCHGPKLQNMGHGGGYRDTLACVLCHSSLTNVTSEKSFMAAGLWFGNWIHKIHARLQVDDADADTDFSDVTYPRDIRECVECHKNMGKVLGAGDQTSNWKDHPTAAYCGTCHEGFPNTSHKPTYKVAGGPLHPGGSSTTSACESCHDGTSAPATQVVFPVATVHNTSPEPTAFNPNPKNVPEFNVTLTLSPEKAFYVAGDNITITATLKSHKDNTTVNTKWYASPGSPVSPAGIADNNLRGASVAVYGPRALPKPILNLPKSSAGLVPQTANLFIGSKLNDNTVNARVLTDNTGFRYKLTIPSGLANGTYGVRLRFADYGYVSDNNYVTESIAFRTIQIGTATAELKVAGDGCTACHGVGDFLDAHDARHAVVFDTDQCNACHDYSGNHASVLANRVHAVHAANTFGDMLNTQKMQTTSGGFNPLPPFTPNPIDVDWSEVTYPQSISNCATCHTSGKTSYRTVIHEVSCLGCHGDNIYTGGVSNHMLQNGGDWPTP